MKKDVIKLILGFQKNEITEHFVYKKLAKFTKGKNKATLEKIADEELKHYNIWKKYTKKKLKPNKFQIFKYVFLAKIFGLTFSIKLMEQGEENAQNNYEKILKHYPETKSIIKDEDKHEKELIKIIEEEKLNYIGSMVLGLNDALVELTGALAGLTFALGKTRLIGLAGLITGIAASFSMMSSEYLSKKAEHDKTPIKASIYTGIAYILTVFALVSPYFLLESAITALLITLILGIGIIFIFTFFVSVTKEEKFKSKFFEMVIISISVAIISFIIGYFLNNWLGIQ